MMRLRRRRLSEAALAYRRGRRRDRARPWRDERYAVVDLETTGLDPRHDEIISFASVPIEEGRIVVGGARTAIIRPERMPEAETIRIHGLRPADLERAPPLPQVLDLILGSLTARTLVAHVAWVESGFLEAILEPHGLRAPAQVVDTAALAVRGLGLSETDGDRAPALSELARLLELPVHSPHTAAGDALTTAQVFLALATRLDRSGAQTIGSLAANAR